MAQINKIGVIGAGNMGSGIAQKIAHEGIPVVMVDLKEEFVQRGLDNDPDHARSGGGKKNHQAAAARRNYGTGHRHH